MPTGPRAPRRRATSPHLNAPTPERAHAKHARANSLRHELPPEVAKSLAGSRNLEPGILGIVRRMMAHRHLAIACGLGWLTLGGVADAATCESLSSLVAADDDDHDGANGRRGIVCRAARGGGPGQPLADLPAFCRVQATLRAVQPTRTSRWSCGCRRRPSGTGSSAARATAGSVAAQVSAQAHWPTASARGYATAGQQHRTRRRLELRADASRADQGLRLPRPRTR